MDKDSLAQAREMLAQYKSRLKKTGKVKCAWCHELFTPEEFEEHRKIHLPKEKQ